MPAAGVNARKQPERTRRAGGLILPRRLRSLSATLVVAVACAIALLLLVDHSFQRLVQVNVERQSAQAVRATIDGVVDNMAMAESSQRGFIMTGGALYRTSFDNSTARVEDLLKQLGRTAAATLLPHRAVGDFKALVRQKLDAMAQGAALQSQGRDEAASFAATSSASDDAMKALRASAEKLGGQTDALIAIESVQFTRLVTLSRLAFLASVLAVLLAFALYIRQRYRLREADLQRQQLLQTERDRLESEVQARTDELAELATNLQRAVEAERAHLARELHDELGALMTAAKLDIARLRPRLRNPSSELEARLDHLKTMLDEAIALKRRIMEDLYPSALYNLGLIPALEILTREFHQHSGVQVVAELAPIDLDAEQGLIAYRVVQEALTNAGKYAQASEVRVSLRQDAERIAIVVADNGAGFDPAQRRKGTRGLSGMRHRLRACGGSLEIDSSAGQGTRLTAKIPRSRG